MAEIIKERMVVVWNEDGSFRGASLDELIRYEDGLTRNTQRPLTEADADALVGSIDADVIAQLDSAKLRITELETQLAAVKEQLPFNPRMIDPGAWYARLTMDHVLAITEAATKDPIANSFVVALKESRQFRREDPKYQMSLDHPNAQAGIAYLSGQPIPIDANGNTATIQSPVFTTEEAIAMLADSRADEQ